MTDQITPGRHRRSNFTGAHIKETRVLIVLRDGPRRQARRGARRMTRRTISFVVIASMMFLQLGLAAGLALWASYAPLTRIALALGGAFAWWATMFLVLEAMKAAKPEEDPDACDIVDHGDAGGDAADSVVQRSNDTQPDWGD